MILRRELHALADTEALARDLAEKLTGGKTIGLIGELGAGKTTLVKFLVSALGANEEVSSPTFVLQHIYQTQKLTIEHWDLYRVRARPEELDLDAPENVLRVVEWPEHGELACDIEIRLSFAAGGWRVAEISIRRPAQS